jgi:hypothetical protein
MFFAFPARMRAESKSRAPTSRSSKENRWGLVFRLPSLDGSAKT